VDPFQLYLDNQAKVNEKMFAALEALTNRVNPPPAPPAPTPPKRLEDMTEEEVLLELVGQRVQTLMDERFKPMEAERAAAQAAKEAADKQAAFQNLAGSIYKAADAAVVDVVGADRLAGLSAEDKAAVADEILSAQAAHAERKDAQGNVVGLSAAEGAAMVKARWARMARLFGAPAPAARPQPPRAQVGQRGVPSAGTVAPTPFVDSAGNQVNIPDAKLIHSKYGGSTDKILDGLADGFRKAQSNQS
jgi:hypothetical protein